VALAGCLGALLGPIALGGAVVAVAAAFVGVLKLRTMREGEGVREAKEALVKVDEALRRNDHRDAWYRIRHAFVLHVEPSRKNARHNRLALHRLHRMTPYEAQSMWSPLYAQLDGMWSALERGETVGSETLVAQDHLRAALQQGGFAVAPAPPQNSYSTW
jgi:hypothetical protein